MNTKLHYLELFFIIALIGLSLYIIYPLWSDILWAAIIGYILNPVYKFLLTKVKYKRLSAFITVLLGISIFIILTTYLILMIIPEVNKIAIEFYNWYKESTILKIGGLSLDVSSFYRKVLEYLIAQLPSVPKMLLDTFVIFILAYYFLIDGETIKSLIQNIIPVREEHKQFLMERISEITKGILYGHIFGATVQAVTSYIGFKILGYQFPVLYSILVFVLSILPVVGPWTLWIPLAIIKIIHGEIFVGIFSIAYALLIVGTIDDLVRPKVASSAAKVHPLITFLGMFGGVFSFGPVGIFIGPLVLGFTVDLLNRLRVLER